MPRGKKGSGKSNGAGKRDLTGKKAGKPTRAEMREAVMAMKLEDRKATILEVSNNVTSLRKQQKSIGDQIQAEREKLNAIGITKRGFDFAMALMKMDPEDRDDTLEALGLTMEANGLGRQDDLFMPRENVGGDNDGFDRNDNAERAGFKAASEGQFRTQNPHAPDTGEHDAWNEGWDRQTKQHAESMAPQEAAAVH
ncbi:MAG TPA: hypothetical protein VEA35_00495 [Ramlibacter sp.]|nr:hypothetical protein [Ramlibacter sp.]